MKQIPTFYFEDEPQFACNDPREYIAHLLRAYRKNKRYILRRVSAGRYSVVLNYPGSPGAMILTRGAPCSH